MSTSLFLYSSQEHQREAGGVAALFGKLTGRKPSSAAQRIHGNGNMKDEFKQYALACQKSGRMDMLVGYVEDLKAIVEALVGAPDLTLELADKAQSADSEEETRERRFWQTETLKDLSMLIRAEDLQIATSMQYRAALRAREVQLLAVQA